MKALVRALARARLGQAVDESQEFSVIALTAEADIDQLKVQTVIHVDSAPAETEYDVLAGEQPYAEARQEVTVRLHVLNVGSYGRVFGRIYLWEAGEWVLKAEQSMEEPSGYGFWVEHTFEMPGHDVAVRCEAGHEASPPVVDRRVEFTVGAGRPPARPLPPSLLALVVGAGLALASAG